MEVNFSEYLPIIIFFMVALGFALVILMLAYLLAKRKPTLEKNKPFECGFDSLEEGRIKFDVKFYLVAILFIVFDLEIAFLSPWSVVARSLGTYGFCSMMIFIFILLVGFLYEWKKGALQW